MFLKPKSTKSLLILFSAIMICKGLRLCFVGLRGCSRLRSSSCQVPEYLRDRIQVEARFKYREHEKSVCVVIPTISKCQQGRSYTIKIGNS
jgi:hypothetical protein